MLDLLKGMFTGQNQFASGGLLLMVVGGLSIYLRAIPEKIWEWIVSQTTMMITVKDDDAAFVWVKEWFLEQKFLQRVRRVDLDTTMRNERIAMIPHQAFTGSGTRAGRSRSGSCVVKMYANGRRDGSNRLPSGQWKKACVPTAVRTMSCAMSR